MKKTLLSLLVFAMIGAAPALAADVVRVGNLKFAHYGAVWYMKEIAAKYNLEIQERIFPKGIDIIPAVFLSGSMANRIMVSVRGISTPSSQSR